MARIFGDQEHKGGAKTHVLIIGVGRYRHLVPARIDLPALGQLTSPPISARAFADWFTNNRLNNKKVPLGSVELVLSDPNSQVYGPMPVEDATFANIQAAFDRWFARCNAHAGNTAIFYFCGHGLQKDSMVLLPEDFGESQNNAWLTAIDFHRTFRGMSQCQAGTQFYILDACRQLSQKMIKDLDAGGQTLKTFKLESQLPRTAPGLFATANGLPSFGDTGKVSRMTAALIDCLDGLGATIGSVGWVIDTDSLGSKVQALIKHRNEKLPIEQQQTVDPTILENANGPQRLHTIPLASSAKVIIKMECEPDEPVASFYLVSREGRREAAPQPGRWSVEKEGGLYEFGCQLGPADHKRPMVQVQPPVWPVTFDLS
jgi:hypothetical protein